MNEITIRFENWQKVLRETVPVRLQTAYHEASTKFRYWLWEQGKAANVAAFKEHLALQDLLGHADISTTQIYLYTAQQTGVGIRSPLDD